MSDKIEVVVPMTADMHAALSAIAHSEDKNLVAFIIEWMELAIEEEGLLFDAEEIRKWGASNG